MASTEPKVQADHDLLGCLPTALAEQIWDSLSCSARQNLLATSRSLQAVFGSVVSSVDFTLPEDSGSGDPFRGLHPSIKPTRVAVKAVPSADLEDPDNHMGSFDSPCEDHPGLLQFISHSRDSQHLARLEFLVVAGFKLTRETTIARALPLVANLKYLVLQTVTVAAGDLADTLSQCQHLEELELLRARLLGPTQPLSVLSKRPSLTLVLDVQEEDLPEGTPGLSFLEQLGGCLTSLDVSTGENELLDEQLIRVTATHLHRLQHLTIRNDNGAYPAAAVFDLLVDSPAAQTLEVLDINVTLPTMAIVAKVLAMPKLRKLKKAAFPEAGGEDLSGLKVSWPEGKPSMKLSLLRATVQQLAALPLQHFRRIFLQQLCLAPHTPRAQREAALAALLAVAHECPSFTFHDFHVFNELISTHPAGLSVLRRGCSIQLSGSYLGFMQLQLETSDMQGVVAAWGPSIETLSFYSCLMTAGAWAAINAAAFPALDTLIVNSPPGRNLGTFVTALCVEWPEERPLTIELRTIIGGEVVAAGVRSILEARGRHNVTVEYLGMDGDDDD